MKSILIFTTVLLLSISSWAQFTDPTTPSSSVLRNDYLNKSKKQEKAAWILLGSGVALFATGMIVFPKDWDWLFGTTPEKEDEANLAGVLLLIGTASTLSSIPLFIASGKNKRRANNITASLVLETSTSIQKKSFAKNSYPALSLKLQLK